MSKVIGVMGESGSGKTTGNRMLPPKETFYCDCDKKGLNWKDWRKQYSTENKNYLSTDSFSNVAKMMDRVNTEEQFKHIKYFVIDTLNGLMVAEEMRILAMQSGDKRSAWSDLAQNGWAIINKALELRPNLTVIILMMEHTLLNYIYWTRILDNAISVLVQTFLLFHLELTKSNTLLLLKVR